MINCLFCKLNTSRYKCQSCKVNYYYYLDEDILSSYNIVYNDGNKTYYATFYVHLNRFHLDYLSLGKINKWHSVLELDYLPDITPDNIHIKIKTLLTFL